MHRTLFDILPGSLEARLCSKLTLEQVAEVLTVILQHRSVLHTRSY